ncbi:hypothetical protein QZH41_009158 [Actinostola sp. cb2023]|nr:hypothetical protein QZH41_009158 [Actinostola sp. cb2023]
MVLVDHVISTHHVTCPIECSFFCAANDKCKSYNYKPRGAGDQDVCQLNNATRQTNPASYKVGVGFVHYFDESETFKSCLDYLRNGAEENGIYTITDTSGDSYQVFCDLTSEPRSAWTLIMSQAYKNRNKAEFCSKPLTINATLKENTPNWEAYRLSLSNAAPLQTINTPEIHHRFYCLRSGFQRLFASKDSSTFICQFDGRIGSVVSEDNFGHHCTNANPKFRGTANDDSTTEYWFGGYL